MFTKPTKSDVWAKISGSYEHKLLEILQSWLQPPYARQRNRRTSAPLGRIPLLCTVNSVVYDELCHWNVCIRIWSGKGMEDLRRSPSGGNFHDMQVMFGSCDWFITLTRTSSHLGRQEQAAVS